MEKINLSRLKNCMARAQRGEELTIGFLGGSITQGSLATEHENTYAYRVFTWWKETFPNGKFHYVNGGIGGTTSHYGVSRAVTDVLMYQPDFVVVDFSVNDEPDKFFQETYEGVIRKLLQWKSEPAVVILNNVFYDTGKTAQDFHNAVGNWYQVPHVSMKDTLYQEMQQGKYTREELTPDGLHPNDKGHKLVAEKIIAFLEEVRSHMAEKEDELTIPESMTQNAYENARRLTIREISPELAGFRADTEEKTGHLDHFKTDGLERSREIRLLLRQKAPVLQYSTEKPFISLHCAQSLCWTGTEPMRYFLMQISMKTGVTACIWNQSFTMGKTKLIG